jgi:hypothetical protein
MLAGVVWNCCAITKVPGKAKRPDGTLIERNLYHGCRCMFALHP